MIIDSIQESDCLLRSVVTHACPTWDYAADAHLLKLQRLQNRTIRAIGNLDRYTPATMTSLRHASREAYAAVVSKVTRYRHDLSRLIETLKFRNGLQLRRGG
jgi:heme oxygenase